MVIVLPKNLDVTEVKAKFRGMIACKKMRVDKIRLMDFPSEEDQKTAQAIVNIEVSDINLLQMLYDGVQ